ncbi:MAG: twitch domain-containing radical SAM protein [Bdellovibrionales bacterium]
MKLEERIQQYNKIRSPKDRTHICHAPFVSLNFEQNGNVTACCYNRSHVLGRYPESSISEIWNQAKVEELRQAIRDNDLSLGCRLCYDQLMAGNFESMLTKNFDKLPINGEEAIKKGPFILEFEISNACNLECVMCNGYFSSSIRKNREKLPPLTNPYDDKFVDQLTPYLPNLVWAKFLGGEPFLNPLYFKIWEKMIELQTQTLVVITTNATIMNERVKNVLQRVKPLLVLSIDSMRKETYEKIRVNAKYDQVQKNLEIFLDYARKGGRTIDLAVCPMTMNWEEIPSLFNWGTKETVQVNLNTVVSPHELSLRSLPREKLREIAQYYKSTSLKTWKDFYKDPSPWTKTISQNNQNIFKGFVNQVEHWSEE